MESIKKLSENQARSQNRVLYSVRKEHFPQVFAEFKTFNLSEEDFQLALSLENSVEETYNKFENEFDRFANLAKELKYEINVSWSKLEDICCPIDHPWLNLKLIHLWRTLQQTWRGRSNGQVAANVKSVKMQKM